MSELLNALREAFQALAQAKTKKEAVSCFEALVRVLINGAKTKNIDQLVYVEDSLTCLYWQIQSWKNAFKGLCILDSALQFILHTNPNWELCGRCYGTRQVTFEGREYDVCITCVNLGVVCKSIPSSTGQHKGRLGKYVNGQLKCQNGKKTVTGPVMAKRLVTEPIKMNESSAKVEVVEPREDYVEEPYREVWVDVDNIFP